VAGHISDDDLERYAMGTVKDEAELAALEEHLLVCGPCIDRAENTDLASRLCAQPCGTAGRGASDAAAWALADSRAPAVPAY
jgi:hypothetical protein